jgi:hypothetical protein
LAAVTAAAAGAALALYRIALENGCAALFWPRLAACVAMLGGVAGGLAALGVAAGPAALGERVRRHARSLLGAAGLAVLAALLALRALAAQLAPGPGLGLLSFPFPFLALAAAPFVVTAAVLTAWCRAGEQRRCGWLLAGAGAGWLAAAAVAGSSLPLRTPWFGGQVLEFGEVGDGAFNLGIDRRLRQDVIAPRSSPPLAFWPRPDGGRDEVLLVGFPSGPLLSAFLERPNVRLTVLEEDAALVAEVLRRWPALERARAEGRVILRDGNPRWSLVRSEDRYSLIALSEGWSPGAYLSRALNLRADHRWTVEAFRSYLAHLNQDGFLLVQRTGIGRVVTTLREAAGVPAKEFSLSVVIFGDRGRLTSQLWYHPGWVRDGVAPPEIRRHAYLSGSDVLYRPSKYQIRTVYEPLVKGEGIRGMYFSTPLDLSPPVDARPFFDHVERLVLSPIGRSLPEELEPMEARAAPRIIPSGDRDAWGLLGAGLLAAALVLVAGLRRAHRGAGDAPPAAGFLPAALFTGICASCALTAFGAWARWLAASSALAQATVGAALLGAGGGWLRARCSSRAGAGLLPLAGVLTVFAAAGYRAAPIVPTLGIFTSALIVAGAGAGLGLVLGRALGTMAMDSAARLPGTGGWFAGAASCAASLTWVGGRLAATHFGYPLLWALAAVAAAAAVRSVRFQPSPGPPPGPPT